MVTLMLPVMHGRPQLQHHLYNHLCMFPFPPGDRGEPVRLLQAPGRGAAVRRAGGRCGERRRQRARPARLHRQHVPQPRRRGRQRRQKVRNVEVSRPGAVF